MYLVTFHHLYHIGTFLFLVLVPLLCYEGYYLNLHCQMLQRGQR